MRPTQETDGTVLDNRVEVTLWSSTMADAHGDEWRTDLALAESEREARAREAGQRAEGETPAAAALAATRTSPEAATASSTSQPASPPVPATVLFGSVDAAQLVRHLPVQAQVSVVRLEPLVQGRGLDHRRHPGGLAGPERLRH